MLAHFNVRKFKWTIKIVRHFKLGGNMSEGCIQRNVFAQVLHSLYVFLVNYLRHDLGEMFLTLHVGLIFTQIAFK